MRTADDTPNLVLARDTNSPDTNILIYTQKITLLGHKKRGVRSLLGDYLGLIKGMQKYSALLETHRIFQGTERDHKKEGYDEKIYVYVSKPPFQCSVDTGPPIKLKNHPVAHNKIFAVYVALAKDFPIEFHAGFDEHLKQGVAGEIWGWEWIDAEGGEYLLPLEHKTRYRRPIWPI